jgi:hypothetical protein
MQLPRLAHIFYRAAFSEGVQLTETELQTLRIIVSITAIRTLLRECFIEIAGTSPNRACRYREIFAALRSEQPTLALNGIDPALQELAANEYQEALDELLSYIESGLRNELSSQSLRPSQGQAATN